MGRSFRRPARFFAHVFGLYATSLLLFVLCGLGVFYHYQSTQVLDDAYETNGMLADVMLPTLSDSVVIGDYDTIKRTLAKAVVGSSLASAEFIDARGGHLRVDNPNRTRHTPPNWLTAQIAGRLYAINRNLTVGGKDYGVLRLNLAANKIAGELWRLTEAALLTALLGLLAGLALILFPLRRIAIDLEMTSRFADDLKNHQGTQAIIHSRVREIQALVASLNSTSQELTEQHQALTDSEARKGAMLEASLDCLITVDAEGYVVDFNPAAETTFGYRRDEVLGQLMSALIIPPALRSAHENGMRRFRATGEGPVLRRRIEISAMRRDGSEFPIELSIAPFMLAGKQFFLGSIRDISERKKLEAEQKRISNLLHQTVADLQVRQLALDEHAIVGITNLQGSITYANQKFVEVSRYSREELLGANFRLLKSGRQDAQYYRQMWDTITAGRVWHGEVANRRKDGEIYWVAYTIVPMLDETGQAGGYISIGTDISAQKHAEQALANARRRELETGSAIQHALLFGDLPEAIQGAQLAAYTEPSQGIDGDFYAITRFRADCFELLVGDVMGKGVPAALVGAGVKSSYHKVLAELFARPGEHGQLPTPAEIVNAMHGNLTRRLAALETFVTLALYRFDTTAGTLTLVNAGHTPAMLIHATQEIEQVGGDNLPLGVIDDEIYTEKTLPIHAGESLLVFSDGITEAANAAREEFGYERLAANLRQGHAVGLPPSAQLQSIRQEVRHFAGSDELHDDQTALIVSLPAPQQEESQVLILPWQLSGLDALRTTLPEAASQLDEASRQAVLLASFEAASNILRHAQPYFTQASIACRMTQSASAFIVELIYPGPQFTPPSDPQPDFSGESEGGFGLYIIKHSVDEVSACELAPGIACIRLLKHLPCGVQT